MGTAGDSERVGAGGDSAREGWCGRGFREGCEGGRVGVGKVTERRVFS